MANNSKDLILKTIKKHIFDSSIPLPKVGDFGVRYQDRSAEFKKMLLSVGASFTECQRDEIDEVLRKHFKNLDKLGEDELSIIEGEFGVAENGAIWVKDDRLPKRSAPFRAENLVIIIDPNRLVDNMHQAFEMVDLDDIGYGVFISGPSKTADIEQTLVIGAHGAKSLLVVIVD